MAVTAFGGVDSGTVQFSSPATVVFGATPSDGELIVLWAFTTDKTSTITGPAGFTALGPYDDAGGAGRIRVFWKIAASEASASYNVAYTGGSNFNIAGFRCTGFNVSTPIEVIAGQTNGVFAHIEGPDITTLTAGAMHVALGGGGDALTAWYQPSGYAAILQNTGNGQVRMSAVGKIIASPAATGVIRHADINNANGLGVGLSIKPSGPVLGQGSAVVNNTFNATAVGRNGNPYVIESVASALSTRTPSVTFTQPIVAGDIVIMWPSSTGITQTITEPSGWINPLGAGVDVESDSHQICCIYHVVTSGEETAQTLTYAATNLYGATTTGNTVAALVRNVDPAAIIDSAASTFDSTNTVTPHVLAGLTGSNLSNDSLVLSAVAKDGTGAYSSTPAGWTMLATSNTNQGKALLSRTAVTVAGTNVTATNITPSAGDEYASITVALSKLATHVQGGSAVVNNTFNAVAAGARTPKGSATINDTFNVVVAGKRVPKGSTTVNDNFDPTAAGKRVPKGAATVSDTFNATANGKKFPKGSAVVNDAFDPVAFGKRFPQGSVVVSDTFNATAAGQAPTVGGAAGSALISDTFNVTAAGKRTPKGVATISNAFDAAAAGKRTPKGTVAVNDTFNVTAVGKRVPKGATTISNTFNPATAGKRVPKGSGAVDDQWTAVAMGFAPQVGGKQGFASISDQWAVSAAGKRSSKGTAAAAGLWQVTAAGVAPVVPQHFGAATVATVWPVTSVGARMSKGAAAAYAAWALEAFGDSTGMLGVLNGIGFVEWMYEDQEIVDWLVGA